MRVPFTILLLFIGFNSINASVNAHSGRTDSSGGHNCNVGSCAGTYHYHNSGNSYTPPKSTYVPVKPTCGANTYLDTNSKCICNQGYVVSPNKIDCVYLPANAHAVTSRTEAWECNEGYEEIGNSCVKIKEIITQENVKKLVESSPTTKKAQPTVGISPETSTKNDTLGTSDEADNSDSLIGWFIIIVVGVGYWIRSRNKKLRD